MANIFVEWWENEPKQIVENFIQHCKTKQDSLKKFSMQIENEVLQEELVAREYRDSVKKTSKGIYRKVKDPILKQRNEFFKIMFKTYNFDFYLKLAKVGSIKDTVLWLVEQYAGSEQTLNDLYDLFENHQSQLDEKSVSQVIDACTIVEKLDISVKDAVEYYTKSSEDEENAVINMTNFVNQYIDRLDNNDMDFHQVFSISY